MKTRNDVTSACRYCRFYNPEGRRGGMCQQLGVPVRGCWKSCSLATSVFAPSWEALEEIMSLSEETLTVSKALPSTSSADIPAQNPTYHKDPSPSLVV